MIDSPTEQIILEKACAPQSRKGNAVRYKSTAFNLFGYICSYYNHSNFPASFAPLRWVIAVHQYVAADIELAGVRRFSL
jgi:hypothetical protein